jgi:hypothetical protein
MPPSTIAKAMARRTNRGPNRAQPSMNLARDQARAAARSEARNGPASRLRAPASAAAITVTVPALTTAPKTMPPRAATTAESATPASAAGTVASAVRMTAALSMTGADAGSAPGTESRSSSSPAPASGIPASTLTTDSAMPCPTTTGQLAAAITLPRSRRARSRGASIDRSTIPSSGSASDVPGRRRHCILQRSVVPAAGRRPPADA